YRTAALVDEMRLHLFLEASVIRPFHGKTPAPDPLRFPWRSAALARLRAEVGSSLKIDVDVIDVLERYDLVVSPAIEYVFSDLVTAKVGYLGLWGAAGGLFAAYARNARVTGSMEMRF